MSTPRNLKFQNPNPLNKSPNTGKRKKTWRLALLPPNHPDAHHNFSRRITEHHKWNTCWHCGDNQQQSKLATADPLDQPDLQCLRHKPTANLLHWRHLNTKQTQPKTNIRMIRLSNRCCNKDEKTNSLVPGPVEPTAQAVLKSKNVPITQFQFWQLHQISKCHISLKPCFSYQFHLLQTKPQKKQDD